MNNLWTLIKIEFSKSFSRTSVKENKAKSASFLAILGFVVLLGIALSTLYAVIYGNMFIEYGATLEPLVILFASVASMLTLMSGINQAKSIFIGKDYDTLSALPLKKTVIIASKVINLYLVELLYSSIILIPSGIVFTILGNNITFLFASIIMAVFISAFPLVIAMIFSFITAIISEKFKYGNFLSIFFYIIFLAGIFALSFLSSSKNNKDVTALFGAVADVAKWINPPLYFASLALYDNFLYILVFVGISVASIVIVILVISLFFDRIHELVTSIKADYKYERKYLKTKNELKTLLDIEFKRLVNSKMYFMNIFVGLIMAIIMGVWMAITFSNFSPFGISDEIKGYVHQYAFFGSLLIVFSVGIANPCAIGISMEGANFWLIKSLPINLKKYMWAKLLLALIIQIPAALITSTAITIILLPNVISIVALYLVPVMYILLTTVVSLLLNLTFYKLKWKNEQEVVKSSSSVVISMFLGFGIDIVLAGILVGLGFINQYLGVFLSIGLLTISTIIFYAVLSSTFERKISRIEEF